MNISFVGTEEEIKFIQKRNTNLSKILSALKFRCFSLSRFKERRVY